MGVSRTSTSGVLSGKSSSLLGALFAAESAVQSRKNGRYAGVKLLPVGMSGLELGHDECAFVFPPVIVMGNRALGGQGTLPVGWGGEK